MPTEISGSAAGADSEIQHMATTVKGQVLTKPAHDVKWDETPNVNTIQNAGFANQGGVNDVQFVLPAGTYWINATALVDSSAGHTKLALRLYINGVSLNSGTLGANDAYNGFISRIAGAGGVRDLRGTLSYTTLLVVPSGTPSLVKMVIEYHSSTDGQATTILEIGSDPIRGQWSIMKIA